MNKFTIEVSEIDCIYEKYKYYAVFEGYHGAPIDNETPSQDKIGRGDTEMEAMYDLIEQSL